MEKFIPFQKLSKAKKKELTKLKRKTWGALNPVTRKPANPNAYNRKKTQQIKGEPFDAESFDLSIRFY